MMLVIHVWCLVRIATTLYSKYKLWVSRYSRDKQQYKFKISYYCKCNNPINKTIVLRRTTSSTMPNFCYQTSLIYTISKVCSCITEFNYYCIPCTMHSHFKRDKSHINSTNGFVKPNNSPVLRKVNIFYAPVISSH